MMRPFLLTAVLALAFALPAVPQRNEPERNIELPHNSPSKVLRHQHEEVKKMGSRLSELASEVEEDLDKKGQNILPLETLKKLEEIEKLARKMRDRLKQ